MPKPYCVSNRRHKPKLHFALWENTCDGCNGTGFWEDHCYGSYDDPPFSDGGACPHCIEEATCPSCGSHVPQWLCDLAGEQMYGCIQEGNEYHGAWPRFDCCGWTPRLGRERDVQIKKFEYELELEVNERDFWADVPEDWDYA